MYLVDFFKRMMRKSNIPILIYLGLNLLFISAIMSTFVVAAMPYGNPVVVVLLSGGLGILVYGGSLFIAISPLGEAILRLQTGCKKITNREIQNFIGPIFDEVYQRARQQDPSIPTDVKLFMTHDKSTNAFATGRKTVCVTKGMLNQPVDQIKAALGHEFGHLAHKDTDLILLVSIGNLFVTVIVTMVKITLFIIQICLFIFSRSEEGLVALLITFLTTISVDLMMWIWTKIGVLLVMKSCRSNEYEADEFSYRLGYGQGLIALFHGFGHSGAKGLFATLESSHPEPDERIERILQLQEAGVPVGQPRANQNPAAIQNTGMQNVGMNNGANGIPQGMNTSWRNGRTPMPAPAPAFTNQNQGIMQAEQTARVRQPGQTWQPSQAQQPVYAGQPSQAQQPVYAGQPSQAQQPVYAGQPSQAQQPAYAGQPSQPQQSVQMRQTAQPYVKINPNTVFCTNCGTALNSSAKFCKQCGTKVVKEEKLFCTNCGTEVEDKSAVFCVNCGSVLVK